MHSFKISLHDIIFIKQKIWDTQSWMNAWLINFTCTQKDWLMDSTHNMKKNRSNTGTLLYYYSLKKQQNNKNLKAPPYKPRMMHLSNKNDFFFFFHSKTQNFLQSMLIHTCCINGSLTDTSTSWDVITVFLYPKKKFSSITICLVPPSERNI